MTVISFARDRGSTLRSHLNLPTDYSEPVLTPDKCSKVMTNQEWKMRHFFIKIYQRMDTAWCLMREALEKSMGMGHKKSEDDYGHFHAERAQRKAYHCQDWETLITMSGKEHKDFLRNNTSNFL
jgi:hypothetical protein